MRIFNKSLAVAACVAAVTFGAVAPPAYAGVTLYENANYDWGPTMSTGETKHLGWMSDRASSIKNHNHNCSWRYFEDINHRGRNFESSSDFNYLRGLSHADLHWGETWDDRISSIKQGECYN